jgi:hypothetical protein
MKDTNARAIGDEKPNVAALSGAIQRSGQWTVDDTLTELGGVGRDATHRLAEKILGARGLEVNAKNLSSQMRSINRWIAWESGATGKEVRNPNKGSITMADGSKVKVTSLLGKIGKNAQMARDGFTVAMSGDISVANYRRSNRSATIHMQGDAAAAWLENPTYEGMSQFYEGNEISGYGEDLQVEIV